LDEQSVTFAAGAFLNGINVSDGKINQPGWEGIPSEVKLGLLDDSVMHKIEVPLYGMKFSHDLFCNLKLIQERVN
jgi:hypothetical protein